MTISGPQALNSMDDALRDIRREEDEIAKRLARSNERITKFRETEGELFRQLAMVRLDPATQQQLDGHISQAEVTARDRLKQHASELSATEQRLGEIDASLQTLTSERANLLKEVDTQQASLKALSSKIAAAIAKDADYAGKRKAATDLEAIAAESLHKTQQAEIDREQKGRPYRDDPLFMYLWERGYGTKNYRANNLIRWLDGMVADLTSYLKARPNFAMLNEIPLRLREHADRQGAIAKDADAAVDALEAAAIDTAGGKPIREALEAAQAQIAEIDTKMVAAEDERDEKAKAMRSLAQGSDPAFAQALAAFADGLGREDLQALLAEARRTKTGQDDTLIAQIDDARAKVREEETETQGERDRLKTLAARRRELEDIQFEFKKARFDDPRSTFREDSLVGDVLTNFLRGGITAANYWEQWRRSQNWTAGTSDWGGGIGLPNNGRNPWGNTDVWADQDREQPKDRGGFDWPDISFGGSSNRRSSGSSGTFTGGWGKLPSSNSSSGSFSRPRTGSIGTRTQGGFKTGGRF
jgi:hypothetical protein